jgi:hypothetical protein
MMKMINRRTIISFIQLVIGLCFLTSPLSLSQAADVTLTVGDGLGLPGSSENIVVSLDNLHDKVKGVQVDVCDAGDYLSCTECETTERTSGYDCSTNELDDGCCRVILIHFTSGLIEKGTGPAFTLKYDVSVGVPGGECRDLNPKELKVSDESGNPFPSSDIASGSGEFCFDSTIFPCLMKKIYSENSKEVEFLRNFRDQVLSKTSGGRELIRLYYQISPAIVEAMEEDGEFKENLEVLIDGLLPLIRREME